MSVINAYFLVEAPPHADHRRRQTPRVDLLLHERPVAHLHIEHQRVKALRHLLRHDGRGDERNRFHRSRDVAQRIEALVGGSDFIRLPHERETHLRQLRAELIQRKIGAETGNRLELVQRTAGVPQTAAGNHRHHDARGRRDRGADQAGLVPHPARRMLVDFDARDIVQIQNLSGRHHDLGKRAQLTIRHAGEIRGHQERGHLVIGNVASGVPIDQVLDFFHT